MYRTCWLNRTWRLLRVLFGEQGNQSFQYTIRYKGRLQTAEEFDNIVVKSIARR